MNEYEYKYKELMAYIWGRWEVWDEIYNSGEEDNEQVIYSRLELANVLRRAGEMERWPDE